MVECFEERLKKAKCCAAEQAGKYVSALNHGEATDQMYQTLMLVNAYVATLERYIPNPVFKRPQGYLTLGGSYLGFGPRALYLSCPTRCEHVPPDRANCITEMDVQTIFEQITTLCGGCSCNC